MAVNDAAGQLYERMLILRCQAGDEAALAELIATYSPRLRLFLRKLIRQDPAADDLLQDTWFDVYRKINALENPQAFAAWLYRIARDKAYRALRRRPEPISPADENWTDSIAAEEPQFTHEDIEQRLRRAGSTAIGAARSAHAAICRGYELRADRRSDRTAGRHGEVPRSLREG